MAMRNRVLAGAACVALTAGLAACGTATTATTTITGTTLTIYASNPLNGPEGAVAQDVLDAEKLALQQAGSKVGRFTIQFHSLNDATSAGWSPKLIAANARTVIEDPTAIAYLGEIDPNASAQSIPITNADQLMQVSPYDPAIGLTQATPAVSGSPDNYYESLSTNGRTFGRVVPSDRNQAKAELQEMQSAGVKKVFIVEDGEAYGDALALAVEGDASKYGITATPPARTTAALATSGAGALFYAGVTTPAAAVVALFNNAITSNPQLKLFVPGGPGAGAFAAQLSPAAQGQTYLSEPGLTAAELSASAPQFLSAFKSAYGHPPATQAIFGYAAMQVVLSALRGAGANVNSRAAGLNHFLGAKNVGTALGTISIDKNGDPTFASGAPYIFSRVRANNVIVPKGVTVP